MPSKNFYRKNFFVFNPDAGKVSDNETLSKHQRIQFRHQNKALINQFAESQHELSTAGLQFEKAATHIGNGGVTHVKPAQA